MTEKEYEDLEAGDLIHYIDDNPVTNPEDYNWKIMHITSEGLMMETEGENPVYLERDEVLEQMDVSRPMERIERWRLGVTEDNPDAWKGEITVTLNREDLNIIIEALSTAEYEGALDKSKEDMILDKLNIEHR